MAFVSKKQPAAPTDAQPVDGWAKAIIDAWDGLIYVCGADYRIQFMNRRFQETLGRDATGEFCYTALHGRDAPCPWCPQEVFTGERVGGFFQKPLDDRWYQVVNLPLPLPDGSSGKVAFIRECEEPDSLIRDLPVFRNILDHLSDAICFHDPQDGRLLYVNELVCTLLGYQREELLDSLPTVFAEFPEPFQDWQKLRAQIHDRGSISFEAHYLPKTAPSIPVEVKATQVQAGLQTFIVMVARDISGRKQAEAHLIEERNKIESIMAAMGDGITVVDRNYRILYQNEVLIRRRGLHLGEPCYRVFGRREEACEECQTRMSFEDGEVHCRPFSTTTPEGAPLHLEITSSPLRDAAGEIIACVEVVRDVTSRRQLEQSREEAFSAVSHEMRTPLTAILGFAQFLLEHGCSADQQQEYLELIAHEGERLKRLIDNLLSLQRLRAGFGLLAPGPVLLYPLLHEVAEHYRTPLVRQRIDIACPPQLPPVQGEALKLQELVANLLDNAVKYAPQGKQIVLGARSEAGCVLLWVQDQGPGIPEDKKDQIFERFYRLEEPKKTAGTGLGLALVKEIAQAHGGQVWVENASGGGSIFYLRLPLAD